MQQSGAFGRVLPHLRPKATHSHILDRIEFILSAYRKNDLANAEGFIAQLAAVLELFPQEVVDYVTDPRTGVQSHIKWLPSIAEVRSACDERMAQLRAKHDREYPALPAPEIDRSGRETLEQLKARCGPNWGLKTIGDPIKGAA